MGNNMETEDKVRCVRIDPVRRTVREEFIPREHLRRQEWRELMGFSHHDTVASGLYRKGSPWLMLAYHQPDPGSRTGMFSRGFVFDNRDPHNPYNRADLAQWELETSGVDAAGEGLLYAFDGIDRRKVDPDADAIGELMNFPWSLDEVRRRIVLWTEGVFRRLPEITSMLCPRFDDPSQVELLLRIENELELHTVYNQIYGDEMVQHVRHLTPQMASLSIGRYDLQVVIGRIRTLKEKVRVSIYQVADSRLPLVDSISVTASKAPQWITKALRRFFEQELVVKEEQRDRERRARYEAARLELKDSEAEQ